MTSAKRIAGHHVLMMSAILLGCVIQAGLARADDTNEKSKKDIPPEETLSGNKQLANKAKKHFYKSFLGEQPPELTAEAVHWVNLPGKLSLRKLVGKVVWLEFNF